MEPLKAGCELDALVAEKVMEVKMTDNKMHIKIRMPIGYYLRALPEYSTSIEAAWQVVEKIRTFSNDVEIGINILPAKYNIEISISYGRGESYYSANGETAPHAICLAALKAVGE